MTSTSGINGPGNSNNQYFSQISQIQRKKIEVSNQALQKASDAFVSRVQDKIAGANINGSKATYTIKSRFDQIRTKFSAPITTQPQTPPVSTEGTASSGAKAQLIAQGELPTLSGEKGVATNGQTEETETAEAQDEAFTLDDLRAARDKIGAREGDENYDARYDLNQDGEISFTDIVDMLFQYNTGTSGGTSE
jgi:hypothetical protein